LAASGVATFLLAKDVIAHDASGAEYLHYVRTWSTDVLTADSVSDHPLWRADEGVTAAIAVGAADAIQTALQTIGARLGDAAQVVAFPIRRLEGRWGLVARAAGGTKGSALQWLATHYGCDLEETVCVGDWLNDVPMFTVAGRAFAMGHAPDEVKQAATDVLEEASEAGGGVARVVERAFGITVDG
jgi:hydroxymethylpyrimidine pyrophosphatase-like HAD family hydrolase